MVAAKELKAECVQSGYCISAGKAKKTILSILESSELHYAQEVLVLSRDSVSIDNPQKHSSIFKFPFLHEEARGE